MVCTINISGNLLDDLWLSPLPNRFQSTRGFLSLGLQWTRQFGSTCANDQRGQGAGVTTAWYNMGEIIGYIADCFGWQWCTAAMQCSPRQGL